MNNIQQEFLDYCRSGNLNKVKKLLKDSRVDPSDGDNYAIRHSSGNGYIEVVRELLKDSRVDPSAMSNYAIRLSSRNGHLDVVRELIKDPRINKHELLNIHITDELRSIILTELRNESINKVIT